MKEVFGKLLNIKEKLGMKKIIIGAVVVALVLIISRDSSSEISNPADAEIFAQAPKGSLYTGNKSSEEVIEIIKTAGEKNGWIITEFKANEVIAEKNEGGSTVSASVKIYDKYIAFFKGSADGSDISELREYIEKGLKSSKAH